MKTFLRLHALRQAEKNQLPNLTTLQDYELIEEIGMFQATGAPLTFKLLVLQGIASVATVQRRLDRLKRLGVVVQTRFKRDKRLRTLTLSPGICKIYKRIGRQMRGAWFGTENRRRASARRTRIS